MNLWGSYCNRPLVDAFQTYRQFENRGWDTSQVEQANRYVCPRGAGPGTATILGLQSDVLSWQETESGTLIFGADQQKVTFKNILFLTAECLTPGAEDDPNALYLCHLADWRWPALRTYINYQYNVRTLSDPTADYWTYSQDPNGGGTGIVGAWSWITMLEDIGKVIKSVGNVPLATDISSSIIPTVNPERFRFVMQSALSAYVEVLHSIFADLAYDAANNVIRIVQVGSADATFTQQLTQYRPQLLDAINTQDSQANYLPEMVKVAFLAIWGGAPEEDVTLGPFHTIDYLGSTYSPSITTIPNTVDVVVAPFDAQMACSGNDPTNLTDLQTMANFLGKAYYQRLDKGQRSLHNVYDGLIPFSTGSLCAGVAWGISHDGATTTISR